MSLVLSVLTQHPRCLPRSRSGCERALPRFPPNLRSGCAFRPAPLRGRHPKLAQRSSNDFWSVRDCRCVCSQDPPWGRRFGNGSERAQSDSQPRLLHQDPPRSQTDSEREHVLHPRLVKTNSSSASGWAPVFLRLRNGFGAQALMRSNYARVHVCSQHSPQSSGSDFWNVCVTGCERARRALLLRLPPRPLGPGAARALGVPAPR